MITLELSPLMERQVNRARQGGIRVEIRRISENSTIINFIEGGPVPGWLQVYQVKRNGRWSHSVCAATMPTSAPKTLRVGDIGIRVGGYIEDQARRQEDANRS